VSKKPTYSPEFKEEAAKMMVDSSRPIVHVARELKVNEATLGGWVKRYRDKHADDDPGLRLPDRARLRELEHFTAKARARIPAWTDDYSHHRRRSALGMKSPADYEKMLQAGEAA
jgi:transposase-like protein